MADVDDAAAAKCVALRALLLCQGPSSKASYVCSAAMPVLKQYYEAPCRWARVGALAISLPLSLCSFLPVFLGPLKTVQTRLCIFLQS